VASRTFGLPLRFSERPDSPNRRRCKGRKSIAAAEVQHPLAIVLDDTIGPKAIFVLPAFIGFAGFEDAIIELIDLFW
jgi:hypothetical protein